MPELTPTGAVDVVERQVRRVRRRKNLYELQRTFFLTVAVGAVAAIVVLPFALFASTRTFALAAGTTLAATLGMALVLAGALRRGWLARTHAVAWIEARGALGGRVRTLLELVPRSDRRAGFFHALLAAQVGAGMDAWTPRRLVPRAIAWKSGTAAAAALVVLALAFRLAALGLPAAPATVPGVVDRSSPSAVGAPGERVVVAPGVPSTGDDTPAPEAESGRDSPLTQLASALQENVRQQVWGKAWERIRDQLARAGGGVRSDRDDEARVKDEELDTPDDASEDATPPAHASARDRARRRQAAANPTNDADGSTDDERGQAKTERASAEGAGDEQNGADGTSGAGNGTSPGDLFGGAPVDTATGAASFELSLAARMRNDRGGHQPGGAPAPGADPDARPALAADQRRETAAHRMTVPAAYEHVVREVFAHREEP